MTVTVPKLKNHTPVLVAPTIPSYPIRSWTWQNYLRVLERKYNNWINTYNTTEMGMKDVNDLMQDLYPGPYRVVAHNRSDPMVIGFSLEFDDPKEQTLWLLRRS